VYSATHLNKCIYLLLYLIFERTIECMVEWRSCSNGWDREYV